MGRGQLWSHEQSWTNLVDDQYNMLLAKYYPERCQSYIFFTPYFTLLSDKLFTDAMLKGSAAYVEKLEELFGEFDNQALRQTFLDNDSKALWASNSAEWFDYQEYIHTIKAPNLIFVGAEESTLNDLTILAKKLPQCQLEILPNMDHKAVYWDSANIMTPVLSAFVKKHSVLT